MCLLKYGHRFVPLFIMELIVKSNNKSKLEKIMSLARELGVSVEHKEEKTVSKKVVVPKGKVVSTNALLADFGKNPDFPTVDDVRSKAWPSSW